MVDPSPETSPLGPEAAEAAGADRARRAILWPTPEAAEPAARLAELRRDWQARLKPIDEAERAAVDAIVGTVRRRILLERAELRVLEGLAEGRVDPAMPPLATFARHAARIEKDRAAAERELRELYRLRPVPIPRPDLNPERLEWLADHLRQRAVEAAEALAATLAARVAAPVDARAPANRERGPGSAEPPSGGAEVPTVAGTVPGALGKAGGAVARGATPGADPTAPAPTSGGAGVRNAAPTATAALRPAEERLAPPPSAASRVGGPDGRAEAARAVAECGSAWPLGSSVRAVAAQWPRGNGRRGAWLGSASAIAGLARAVAEAAGG